MRPEFVGSSLVAFRGLARPGSRGVLRQCVLDFTELVKSPLLTRNDLYVPHALGDSGRRVAGQRDAVEPTRTCAYETFR